MRARRPGRRHVNVEREHRVPPGSCEGRAIDGGGGGGGRGDFSMDNERQLSATQPISDGGGGHPGAYTVVGSSGSLLLHSWNIQVGS